MSTRARGQEAAGALPGATGGGITRRGLGQSAPAALAAGGGLAALLAVACGPLRQGARPEAAQPKQPVTVEYWTFYGEDRLAPIRPHLGAWEQRSGFIKLNLSISSMGALHEKVQVSVAAGTPPDVAMSPRNLVVSLNDNAELLNLAPFQRRDRINIERDYTLSGYEIWCDGTYHFPMVGWSLALAYNKTMFQQRGVPDPWEAYKGQWTWDQFVEAATRLTQDADRDGKVDIFGFRPDGFAVERALQPFIATNGGEIFDYEKMRYTLDHPKTVEAMQWVLDLSLRRRVMVAPAEDRDLGRDAFAAARVVIAGDFSYRPAPGAIENIGGRFDWDVVPLPRGRKGEPMVSLAWDAPNMVFRKGKQPEEGYELVKFLGGEEVQRAWGEWRGVQPALMKVRHDPKTFLRSPPAHMHVYNDVWESKRYRDASIYHYGDFEAAPLINKHVGDAFAGKISIREALLKANQEANVLVRYGQCRFQPPWRKR